MLTGDAPYTDLGADFFDQINPELAKHRAIACTDLSRILETRACTLLGSLPAASGPAGRCQSGEGGVTRWIAAWNTVSSW
jgi:hypothetical protein